MYGIRAARPSSLAAAKAAAMSAIELVEPSRDLGEVLVSATAQAHDVVSIGRATLGEQPGDHVRGLQGGDDALEARELTERADGVVVDARLIPGTAGVAEPRVLGPNARIVESRRDGMGLEDLPLGVGQDRGAG